MFNLEFLTVLQCPTPLIGRNLLVKLGIILQFWQRPKWILPVEAIPEFPNLVSQQVVNAWYNRIPEGDSSYSCANKRSYKTNFGQKLQVLTLHQVQDILGTKR